MGKSSDSAPSRDRSGLSQYQLGRELGRGGQAIVREAFQVATGRKVAIKLLRRGKLEASDAVARFEREAEVLTKIEHAAIVRVLDASVSDGSAFLVMEFIDGEPFDTWARALWRAPAQGGALERQRVMLDAFIAACEGVQAVHAKGIAHRDLKPSNVLIDRAGQPRVLDFGIARAFDDQLASADANDGASDKGLSHSITQTGEFIGSMPWADPQRVTGDSKTGPTSDVYALGVMLYQALAGEFPYDVSGSNSEVIRTITSVIPAAPGRVVARRLARLAERDTQDDRPAPAPVSEELDAITLKALAKQSGDRYANAGELAADLLRAVRGETPIAIAESHRRTLKHTARNAVLVSVLVVILAIAVSLVCRQFAAETRQTPNLDGQRNTPTPAIKVTVVAKPVTIESTPPTLAPNQPISGAVLSQVVMPVKGVRTWTLETRGSRGEYWCTDISSDGKRLAVGGVDATIRILDTRTGETDRLLIGHEDCIRDLAWSSDGKWLASAGDDSTWVWDTETNKPTHRYPGSRSVTWSPDAKQIAFVHGITLIVTPGGSDLVRELEKSSSGPLSLRWSPDGKRIASGSSGPMVFVWDAASGKLMHSLEGHKSQALRVAWSRDGELYSCSDEGGLIRWNLAALKPAPMRNQIPTPGFSNPVSISPDGTKVFATPAFFQHSILNLSDGSVHANLKGHRNWPSGAAWSPDGQTIYTISVDRSVRSWEAETGSARWANLGLSMGFYTCAFAPEKPLIAAVGRETNLWVVDTNTVEPIRMFDVNPSESGNPIYQIAWSPDGTTIAMSEKSSCMGFYPLSGGNAKPIVRSELIRSVDYAPAGGRVAFAVGSRLEIWDTTKNEKIADWPLEGEAYEGMRWSPDGGLIAVPVAGQKANIVQVINPDTGKSTSAVLSFGTEIVWSPDATRLFVPFGDRAALDPRNLRPISVDKVQGSFEIMSAKWSPDGNSFAVADTRGPLYFYDGAIAKVALTLRGGRGHSQVDWSRDGKILAQASRNDATVRFWNMPEGTVRGVFTPLTGGRWVRIDGHGRWLGPKGVAEDLLVYAITDDGEYLTLPIAEFEKRFGVSLGEERGQPMKTEPRVSPPAK